MGVSEPVFANVPLWVCAAKAATKVEGEVKPIVADDAFLIRGGPGRDLRTGYGMAVAQAQHVVRNLGSCLRRTARR